MKNVDFNDMLLLLLNLQIKIAHMILFKLFFYVSNVLSRIADLFMHNRFNLIIDIEVFKMLDKDGKEVEEVILRKDFDENKRFEGLIWDKYFPKPIYYSVSYDSFFNSKSDDKLLLNLISVKNDKIIGFELVKKLGGKLSSLNFYDINDQILNRNLGAKMKIHEVVMSNNENNIQPILNSFDYMSYLGPLESSYRVANGIFYTFVKTIHDLMKKTEEIINYNEPIFLKSWETLEHIIKITNMLTRAIATVVVPSLNKDEYAKTLDEFKGDLDVLAKLFVELKVIIKEQTKIYREKNPNNDISDIIDFIDKMKDFAEDLTTDSSSFTEKYGWFLKELQNATEFVKKVKDKNKINTQISLDCDTEKVDRFVEKYGPYLLEYCEILEKFDTIYLHEYYYFEFLKYGGSYTEHLKKMYKDIIIAKEIKRYILNYQTDKNDLLIFLQSNHFKKKLPERILDNLDSLISSLWFKKNFQRTIQGKEVELSENDQNYMEKIRDFRIKWILIFGENNPSDPLSISKIIDNMPIDASQNDNSIETNQSTSEQQESNNQASNDAVKINGETNLSKNQETNDETTNTESNLDKSQSSYDAVKINGETQSGENKNLDNLNNTQGEEQNPSEGSTTDITINPVEVNTTNDKDSYLENKKLNVGNGDNKADDTVKQLPVDQDTNGKSRKGLRILTYISIGVVALSALVGFFFYIVRK